MRVQATLPAAAARDAIYQRRGIMEVKAIYVIVFVGHVGALSACDDDGKSAGASGRLHPDTGYSGGQLDLMCGTG